MFIDAFNAAQKCEIRMLVLLAQSMLEAKGRSPLKIIE